MDSPSSILDIFLKLDEVLHGVLQTWGPWTYVLLFAIILCEPSLRTTGTLAALVALHDAGLLSDERFDFLERAYRTLRAIEGRLRLLDAAARHDFPSSPDEQRTLAHLLGYDRPDALVNDVQNITARTRAEFERIFNETESRRSGSPPA